MEFLLFPIIILAGWIGINYIGAYIFAPFWWSKERIKWACRYSIIFSFPIALLISWLFDGNY